MKILMLSEYFYPYTLGGTEWSVFHLINQIKKSGIKVMVLTPNYGGKPSQMWNGVEIIRYSFPKKFIEGKINPVSPSLFNNPINWITVFWNLFILIKNKRIDLIHVQSGSFLPPVILAKLFFNIPVVVTLRDYFTLCSYGFCLNRQRNYRRCSFSFLINKEISKYVKEYVEKPNFLLILFHYTAALYARIISKLLRICLTLVDKIICISEKQQSIFNLNGIKNTEVIYNIAEFRSKFFLRRTNTVLYIGRLTPGKGARLFYNVARKIAKQNKNIRFKFIGEGILKKVMINELKPAERTKITFMGQMQNDLVLEEIKKAKLVVVPSVWEEPFGRVALESIAQYTPVVATDCGGLPEIIDNGLTGFIVSPTEKSLIKGIKYALRTNNTLVNNIRKANKNLKEKFSIQPYKAHMLLYEKLLS